MVNLNSFTVKWLLDWIQPPLPEAANSEHDIGTNPLIVLSGCIHEGAVLQQFVHNVH